MVTVILKLKSCDEPIYINVWYYIYYGLSAIDTPTNNQPLMGFIKIHERYHIRED